MRRFWPIIGLIWITGPQPAKGQLIRSLGMKAGLSISNQTHQFTPIDYTLDTGPLLAPSAALFMEAFRGESFSLQADLSYVCRGSTTSTHSITVNHLDQDRIIVNQGDPVASRFHYLSLAAMARVRTELKNLVPYALAGPRLDMLLSYSTESDYPLEQQNSMILGLSLGIGLEFKFDRTGLFTELQYQPGLSPVTNREPLLINNNSLIITLGIRRNNRR
jgi:hypothetical protein